MDWDTCDVKGLLAYRKMGEPLLSRSALRLRYTRLFAMSRIGSPHASVVVQVARLIATAFCVAGLVGCGSTIVTRIHTRDVVLSFPIDKRENQARRLEKELKMSAH